MKQLLLDVVPSPLPTLAGFIPGRNTELLAMLGRLARGEEKERFVYLWGNAGCGKTHLLKAVSDNGMRNGFNMVYLSCKPDTVFDTRPETTDCIAVDNVDCLDPAAQISLFNLYNRIRDESRSLLLVSGLVPPPRLALRADLVTRLGWGLVYRVHELTDEEKTDVMKNHATNRGFDLPQEVCNYLLHYGHRDLPSLLAMIDALDEHALANQRQITLPLLRGLLTGTAS